MTIESIEIHGEHIDAKIDANILFIELRSQCIHQEDVRLWIGEMRDELAEVVAKLEAVGFVQQDGNQP